MRSRLTTLLTIGFLSVGTAGALALSGGAGFGLGSHDGLSASVSQYGPGPTPPPVSTPPASTPPASAPPVSAPPPASQSAPHATVALSKHGVATVRCSGTCHVVLRARHGSRHVHATVTLHANGTATIHLSKRALARLGRGGAVLIVEVNGKVIAKRTVRVA
jgi:hypothetical protein